MAEVLKELTLDVFSANRIKAIVAKQYDYHSRYLLIRLTDGGNNINVESSSVVTINAFRPDGDSAAFLGSVESDGRVLVPLAYWMLELEGTVKCDVSIVDTNERKLSSTNFQIEVEHANYSGDDIEPDEHYDLLVELLAEVAQAQEAENARVAAESARVTAENGRVSAETARDTAETARASAESARVTAEGTRSSAETARSTAETARASAETTRQSNETSRVTAEAARELAETAREEAEEEREQALKDYAKIDDLEDGSIIPKFADNADYADIADNLTPYSDESGVTQTQPFFLEGTATGNGESIADAGSYAMLKEKRGNMVCVNQLVDTNTTSVTLTIGHVYFLDLNGEIEIVTGAGESVSVTGGTDIVSDLTQWFGSTDNVPTYLLSHPEAFGRYYKGSLAYELGRLEPATGRYLTSVRRNLYDGEHDVDVSPSTTYYCYGNATITYKDVDGNTLSTEAVNNSTFTAPANCYSLGIVGTDVCISRYYEGESGYDQYYPHEVLANIDTGNEDLGAFDIKYPNGLIERNTLNKIYNGGDDEYWDLQGVSSSGVYSFRTQLINVGGETRNIRAICDKLIWKSGSYSTETIDCFFTQLNASGLMLYVRIKEATTVEEFRTWLASNNLHIQIETTQPTTEQGTPFQETVLIDDFGQLSWSDTDVPQGNEIFYPVDYKAFVDTLINHTDGDANNIALKGELASGDPQTLKELLDYIDAKVPTAPTTDGNYVLKVSVVNGAATYSWEAEQ